MIVIASSGSREREALALICEHRGWSPVECDSVLAVTRVIRRQTPKVVLVRNHLHDGYSDDVINALVETSQAPATKIIVLLDAGASSTIEARQLTLGADCVQRDPIRSDVLVAYVEKYLRTPRHRRSGAGRLVRFAQATLDPLDRTLRHAGRSVVLTPREAMLTELLVHSRQEILTYETLYTEILGRKFKGDTSNMRVLLGKLGCSVAQVGFALRDWVEVIPKTGYRCTLGPAGAATVRSSLVH
jgi:two-component system OmpR family response regulator